MGLDVDMNDTDDADDFRAFCQQATDAQLRNIYWKEKQANRNGYARIAKWVAEERGVEL